jgi:hypothetical protein
MDFGRTGAFSITGVGANLPKKLAAGLLATFILDGTAATGLLDTGAFAGAFIIAFPRFKAVMLDEVSLDAGTVASGLSAFNLKLGPSTLELRFCATIFLQSYD